MSKNKGVVTYTAEEVAEMVARGKDETDWGRVRSKTETQLAADTASDSAWSGIDDAWIAAAQTVHNDSQDFVDKPEDHDPL